MSTVYISASTNRHGHAADASVDSLVAFGSSKLLALWNTSDEHDSGIYQTIPGHEGLITAVRFISRNTIVSGDDKGSVRLWREHQSVSHSDTAQWSCMTTVQAHPKPISSLCVFETHRLVVTGSSDSTIKIWRVEENPEQANLREVQTLFMGGKYPLALAVAQLPHANALILAVGSTDRNVHIFTRTENFFMKAAVLPGHEDWVRSLAFRVDHPDLLVLASGSQDATIRLWNIEPHLSHFKHLALSQADKENTDLLSDDLLDAFEASLGDLADGEEGGRQVSLKRHIITIKSDQTSSSQYSITFDALLLGHEQGITALCWRGEGLCATGAHDKELPTLLSTSTDSSVILWSPSEVEASQDHSPSSIWINRQRFGDIGGQRLGGFVGGLWAGSGKEVLAWGWAGGWRRWQCSETSQEGYETWFELGAIGGHRGPVKGLGWSPKGEYLISAGTDQTTRIHGSIPVSGRNNTTKPVWHELARPQIHGYDLVDAIFLSSLNFVSIADEKVVRVFEAPRSFVDNVEALKVVEYGEEERNRPLGASVPPLGLSNKAMAEAGTRLSDPSSTSPAARRPFEGELAATTLWPETEKVFGHGYESISLAVSRSKRLIATACKSTSPTHAIVRVYDTTKYQPVGNPLSGHSLTVTRMAFSPDDRFILSVSRDRTWMVSERQDDGGYKPVAIDKTHARIIWDCAWAHEGDLFATASRDKTVKIWAQPDPSDPSKWTALANIKIEHAATAVDFSPADGQNGRLLAIGLETGEILIYSSGTSSPTDWKHSLTFDNRTAHVDRVQRLCWGPAQLDTPLQLASCGEDGIVKIRIVHR